MAIDSFEEPRDVAADAAVACLEECRPRILHEIRASARAHEAAKGDEGPSESLRCDIDAIVCGEAVCSAWHPEGYDSVRDYLCLWAPESSDALAHLADDQLKAAWNKTGMFHDCAEAAAAGAVLALERLLESAKRSEAAEHEAWTATSR